MRPPVPGLTVLTRTCLENLSEDARQHPRRRLNRNLHAMEDRVHRLLNAVEPGTYVRPHRHLEPSRTETVIVVSGRLGLVVFDGDGSVSSRIVLTPQLQAFGAEIHAGLYHSFIALERGTVMFEVKEGPYAPVDESDMALWAPGEEDPAAASWVSGQEEAFRQLAAETVKVA